MTEIEEGNIPEEEVPAEAPAEEVAEESQPTEEGIPQWRFNEVNEARKNAEDRAKLYEQALSQVTSRQKSVQQTPKQQNPANPNTSTEDQKWLRDALNPVLEEYVGPLRNEMQSVLDKQVGQDFWDKWSTKIPQDVRNSVEEDVINARNSGVPNVDREHLLDYHLGKYHRNDLLHKTSAATSTQKQVQESNKVAVVESGSTTTEPPDKSLDQMSASELLEKYGNMPFGD